MKHEQIGMPARDGQFDPPPACSVCGRAETRTGPGKVVRSDLVTVQDARGANTHRRVCPACLEAAMRSLGPGTADLHTRVCSAPHRGDDDTRFAVTTIWPPQSFAPPPYWLACTPHLTQALDDLAAKAAPTRR